MSNPDPDSPANKKSKTSTTLAAQYPGDELWKDDWKPSFGEDTIQTRLATTSDQAKFILYSSWFCPFAQRAWIVAEELGSVDYQWAEINPYEVDPAKQGGYTKQALSLEVKATLYPEFIQASPRGLVPAISHTTPTTKEKVEVWESMPVAEYLDAAFGSGTLAGQTPYERARIQIWSAHCTERIQKHYYQALMSQDETGYAKAIEKFYKELRALAQAMSSEGPYFLGSRFSLVDVAFAPFWQRMLWVGSFYMNLTFPNEPDCDRINQWWEACRQRPSIQNTLVCKERLIASYMDYYQGIATSDFAKSMT